MVKPQAHLRCTTIEYNLALKKADYFSHSSPGETTGASQGV